MGYYGFWFIVGVVFWVLVMGFARYFGFQAIQLVCILFFVIIPRRSPCLLRCIGACLDCPAMTAS